MTVLDELNRARSFERSLLHPSLADFASRWIAPAGATEGFSDGYIVSENLVLTSKNFRTKRRCSEEVNGFGRVVFLYHLAGKKRIYLSDGTKIVIEEPSFIAYSQPIGVQKTSVWEQGACETSLGLGFDPKSPPQIIIKSANMFDWLQSLIESRTGKFEYFVKPMTPEIELTARVLIEPSFKKAFLENYLAAKAQELLCVTLETSLQEQSAENEAQPHAEALVSTARRVIEGDPSGTMTLGLVAEAMGVSSRSLSNGIERCLGLTGHKFCQMVRMNHAKYLLMSSEKPLKRIAYRAGYSHTSNFCMAFKKKFGVTPTSVRESRFNTQKM